MTRELERERLAIALRAAASQEVMLEIIGRSFN